MHRILRPLMATCIATALGLIGCATVESGRLAAERKAFRDDLIVEIAETLVAQRNEHRRRAKAQQNTIGALSSDVYALEQRIEEVENARERGETAITEEMNARLAIPFHQSVQQFVAECESQNNKTIRGEIGDLREMVTQRLSEDGTRITDLEGKMPDAGRLDELLGERVERAVGTAKNQLARDLRNDVVDLRRDISNRTALEEPVGAMLESWKLKEGIADLQSTNEYIIPGGIIIAMALLGNAGLALRQRTSKETEEALRIAKQAKANADSAINAADLAQDDVNSLRDEIVGRIMEGNKDG